jgi:prophage regulatory protein
MTAPSNTSTSTATATADDGLLAGHLQYLRIGDVCRLLRISKPTLWRLRQSSDFPPPTQLSDRAIGWSRDEIQTWVEARRQGSAKEPRRREAP